MTIKRINPAPRLSAAVVHGNLVHLAGQVAQNAPGKPPAEQTKDILDRVDALLKEAGTDKSRLLSAVIWLSDIAYYNEMNSVWDKWTAPGCAPARACIEAKLANPAYNVEIMIVAALRDAPKAKAAGGSGGGRAKAKTKAKKAAKKKR